MLHAKLRPSKPGTLASAEPGYWCIEVVGSWKQPLPHSARCWREGHQCCFQEQSLTHLHFSLPFRSKRRLLSSLTVIVLLLFPHPLEPSFHCNDSEERRQAWPKKVIRGFCPSWDKVLGPELRTAHLCSRMLEQLPFLPVIVWFRHLHKSLQPRPAERKLAPSHSIPQHFPRDLGKSASCLLTSLVLALLC